MKLVMLVLVAGVMSAPGATFAQTFACAANAQVREACGPGKAGGPAVAAAFGAAAKRVTLTTTITAN